MTGWAELRTLATALLAQRSMRIWLACCAAAIMAALAAAAAAKWTAQAQRAAVVAARAEREAARSHTALAPAGDWTQQRSRYLALAARGVFDPPDPVAWAEALIDAAAQLRLPAPSFELGPRQASPSDDGLSWHDLRFTISGIHEEELLALLRTLGARARHALRVQQCRLAREGEGLKAECTLRWYVFSATAEGQPVQHSGERR